MRPELIEKFEELAIKEDRDRTYFMRKAMEEYFEDKPKASKAPVKRFTPPTLVEAQDEFLNKGSSTDEAASFVNFYTSKDWKVGKSKMKCWKSAAANWISRSSKPKGYLTAQEKRAERNSEIFDYDTATRF
jgi:hypothetical protein